VAVVNVESIFVLDRLMLVRVRVLTDVLVVPGNIESCCVTVVTPGGRRGSGVT
jgi:hypothetical protein